MTLTPNADNAATPARPAPNRIAASQAAELVAAHCDTVGQLRHLGRGGEGFVMRDDNSIYKLLDAPRNPLELRWQLAALARRLRRCVPVESVLNFADPLLIDGKYVLIRAAYAATSDLLSGGGVLLASYIRLLKDFKRIGWVCADANPKNLRVARNGALILSDIGHSLFPMSTDLFESMCRRMFVIYKLQTKLTNGDEFKPYLTAVNERADFSALTQFGFAETELKREFASVLQKVNAPTNQDILAPALRAVFEDAIGGKTALDYGSGGGEHAQMLTRLGFQVTAYDPDEAALAKHKDDNYINVKCVGYDDIQRLKRTGAKFDAVLCSLVLCHWLDDAESARLAAIDKILDDLTSLAAADVVVAICNPLYTMQSASQIQTRRTDADFDYSSNAAYEKRMVATERIRKDCHRPLAFYERLFDRFQLKIRRVVQTVDNNQVDALRNSDFIIFVLSKQAANEVVLR